MKFLYIVETTKKNRLFPLRLYVLLLTDGIVNFLSSGFPEDMACRPPNSTDVLNVAFNFTNGYSMLHQKKGPTPCNTTLFYSNQACYLEKHMTRGFSSEGSVSVIDESRINIGVVQFIVFFRHSM